MFLAAGGLLPGPPAEASGSCSGGLYELAGPLVGTWQEFTIEGDTETLVGTLESSLDLGGCVFRQSFLSAEGTFAFRSFGFVDPETGTWRELFVFDSGRTAEYRWRASGDEILLERQGRIEGRLHRLRLTQIGPDTYTVWEEHFYDDGATWQAVEETRARRIR